MNTFTIYASKSADLRTSIHHLRNLLESTRSSSFILPEIELTGLNGALQVPKSCWSPPNMGLENLIFWIRGKSDLGPLRNCYYCSFAATSALWYSYFYPNIGLDPARSGGPIALEKAIFSAGPALSYGTFSTFPQKNQRKRKTEIWHLQRPWIHKLIRTQIIY